MDYFSNIGFLRCFFRCKKRSKGNPLWQPILNYVGIQYTPLFVPLVLLFFYFIVKGGAGLTRKVDRIDYKAEELVLTAFVLAYFVFDLWIISVDFFGFRLIRNHYYLIPILVVIVLIYSVWAEKKLKKAKN